jgi:hypothetical protein
MAAVYGPGEVKIMKELAEKAYINVIYKPRVGISSIQIYFCIQLIFLFKINNLKLKQTGKKFWSIRFEVFVMALF